MKKIKIDKILTFIGVALIVASSVLWYQAVVRLSDTLGPVELLRKRQNHTRPRVSSDINQMPVRTTATPNNPQPARQAQTPAPQDAEPTLLQVCETGWQFIAQRSGADLQDDLSRSQLLLPLPCLRKMQKEIKISGIQSFVTHCQLQLETKDATFIDQSCIPWLPQFRAFVIRNLRSDNTDLASLDNTDLANQLIGGFVDFKNAPAEEVQRNIQIANTLIEKDPNFYPAYKAKLLSLLAQELKYGKNPTLETYDDLYDELLSFRSTSPQATVNTAANPELDGIDPDLIHIPFLRLSAKNDVDGLSEMAQDYISAFPNSHIGYMYLAEAAWKSGQREQALNIISSTLGVQANDQLSRDTLMRLQTQDPLERIMEMNPY